MPNLPLWYPQSTLPGAGEEIKFGDLIPHVSSDVNLQLDSFQMWTH